MMVENNAQLCVYCDSPVPLWLFAPDEEVFDYLKKKIVGCQINMDKLASGFSDSDCWNRYYNTFAPLKMIACFHNEKVLNYIISTGYDVNSLSQQPYACQLEHVPENEIPSYGNEMMKKLICRYNLSTLTMLLLYRWDRGALMVIKENFKKMRMMKVVYDLTIFPFARIIGSLVNSYRWKLFLLS